MSCHLCEVAETLKEETLLEHVLARHHQQFHLPDLLPIAVHAVIIIILTMISDLDLEVVAI